MKLIFGYEGKLGDYEYITESYIPNIANSIVENVSDSEVKQVIENSSLDSNVKKRFKLKGIMLQSEVKNRNGRKYPKHIIEREVARYIQDCIKTNSAVGTLGHDDTPNIKEDRVCHRIVDLRMDGNNAIGTAEIIDDFPMGRIAKTYVEQKIRCGMSSRGVGDIDGDTVGDSYNLISIDFVLTPSAPQAYMESVIENKNFIIGNDEYVELAIENLERNAEKIVNKFDKAEVEHVLLDGLMQFIETINFGTTKSLKKFKI